MATTGFVSSHAFLEHDTGPEHPERPARLLAIQERLAQSGLAEELEHLEPTRPDLAWIRRVHEPDHVESVHQATLHGEPRLEADTTISTGSWEAALLAVGGAIEASGRIARGEWQNAFLAARPPGHHAEYAHSMGFCLFNTAVIAARYVQQELLLPRVAILDWDVHHGNGTQHLTERDPSVHFSSLHQFPHYPGTGAATERGLEEGLGSVLNVPMEAGDGDTEYIARFEGLVLPAIEDFAPDFVIVSAGFDAHERDPLSATRVSAEGFRTMSEGIVDLAARRCGGRLLSVLEGGYDLEGLSLSVQAHLEVMKQA
jgi:acetoin utilization deacetylase AcuC-like enzyme